MLRRNDVETMLENARLTASAAEGPERTQEASRQIHHAMFACALGQITEEERHNVLSILRPCCPWIFSTPPAIDVLSPVDWQDSLSSPDGREDS